MAEELLEEVGVELEDPGGELGRLAPLVHIEIGRKHKRPMCFSCNRPASVCWCCAVDSSALQGVRSRVVVLQHPHEQKRCLRTAPMLENTLPHCSVLKGKRFSPDVVPELVSPDSIVLFPGADAVEVSGLATVAERGRPYNLIVIDGTWHQARAIMHKTKELRTLRKVLVRSPVVSHYVIRTQPSDAAVSTVECAALALAVLEDDPDIYTTLVRPLTTLCQHQVSEGNSHCQYQVSEGNTHTLPAPATAGNRCASAKHLVLNINADVAAAACLPLWLSVRLSVRLSLGPELSGPELSGPELSGPELSGPTQRSDSAVRNSVQSPPHSGLLPRVSSSKIFDIASPLTDSLQWSPTNRSHTDRTPTNRSPTNRSPTDRSLHRRILH
ncbi:DTW protein [Trinorchestia longiramus]|nr:DTW protein [Trinorchestia longiramus]